LEDQKCNAKNCKTSSANIWDILDPPQFPDTEYRKIIPFPKDSKNI
jgi:hypothetical protein